MTLARAPYLGPLPNPPPRGGNLLEYGKYKFELEFFPLLWRGLGGGLFVTSTESLFGILQTKARHCILIAFPGLGSTIPSVSPANIGGSTFP